MLKLNVQHLKTGYFYKSMATGRVRGRRRMSGVVRERGGGLGRAPLDTGGHAPAATLLAGASHRGHRDRVAGQGAGRQGQGQSLGVGLLRMCLIKSIRRCCSMLEND